MQKKIKEYIKNNPDSPEAKAGYDFFYPKPEFNLKLVGKAFVAMGARNN